MGKMTEPAPPSPTPAHCARVARWEWIAMLGLTLVCVALGSRNLGVVSIWHDEAVQISVARHIVENGWPALPTGAFYPSALAYNYLLAAAIALFGDSPEVARAPSALIAALNVVLTWRLLRALTGPGPALLSALLLALSPWHLAWAREARFYQLQALGHLLALIGTWQGFEARDVWRAVAWALLAVLGYFLAFLSSFQGIILLGSIGLFATWLFVAQPEARGRAVAAIAIAGMAGLFSLSLLFWNPNPVDQAAIFQTGLGGNMPDPQRLVRWYYLRWLGDNLSTGFLASSFVGTAWALWRYRSRGLFLVLAFWVPLLVLTFLIGYRRDRFLFFAYPQYVALSALGVSALISCIAWGLHGWRRWAVSALAGLFLLRLALSFVYLTGDSLEVAAGSHTTLAAQHPQWAKPTAYLRERMEGRALLTTTFITAHYHLGRADEWFPNRYTRWEEQEAGTPGLGSLAELQDYIARHPRGYFVAEHVRFEMWRHHGDLLEDLGREVAWVQEHLRRIDEASSADVTVYAWGD